MTVAQAASQLLEVVESRKRKGEALQCKTDVKEAQCHCMLSCTQDSLFLFVAPPACSMLSQRESHLNVKQSP